MKKLQEILNNSKYGGDMSIAEKYAKEKGLLIYVTASDDLLEVYGSKRDEVSMNEGSFRNVSNENVMVKEVEGAFYIMTTANDIMYFDVLEDGELYCRGLIIKPKKKKKIALSLTDSEYEDFSDNKEVTIVSNDTIYEIKAD